ncbi:ABC transporter permease [Janibacter alittae]|uniref:ABC transporter permease subunit n=1 Tax=Janibacter alittae TaxID=3115209 RepID=A0ABZ2MK26_9MICO
MSTDVLTRELNDRRTPIAAISAVLVVFAFFVVGISSGLQSTISDLTDAMPEAVTAFIPVGPGGYVVGELFNLMAPLALIAYAVMTGAALIAGEEQAGTMAVLSAQPVSRRSMLAQKALGLAVTLAAITLVFAVAVALSAAFFDIEGLTATNIAAACLHLYLLALLFGAVALATGSLTGNPGLASGVGGGLAVAAWVANSMLPVADLDDWARISPWHYYVGSEPLANGLDATHLLVLALLTALALVVAFVSFDRRDLKG